MADTVADMIDKVKAEAVSKELQHTFHQMSDRVGRGVFLAALAHATGSFCDSLPFPDASLYMAADIAGVDPEKIKRQIDHQRKRGLIVQ